jgi:hypothetical protein
MIDFTKFDFNRIFGVVKGTDGMKRNQTRTVRSEIQEESIALFSDDQLKYVGDTEDGRDFYGLKDGLYYESKAMDGMFLKTKPITKEVTLKNFQGRNLGLPEQTFDYMLLWDTKNYKVGYCNWDACMKNIKIKDAVISFRVDFDDITFVADNITPHEKEPLAPLHKEFIREWILS